MDKETNNNRNHIRYTLRLANEDDLPYIVKYLKDPSRPKTVFERTEKALHSAINNGLMWLLTDPAGNINTTGAVHIIPVQANIGSTVDSGVLQHASLEINFAEIGTVWRQGNAPSGFCLDLIYSAAILQTYIKANDLSISTLVTQAVADNQRGIDKLSKLDQGWGPFLPNREFTHQFQETIPDQESRDTQLVSFYTHVNVSLLGAARCILGLNESPKFSSVPRCPNVLRAYDHNSKDTVEIDLNSTELLQTAKEIIQLNEAAGFDSILEKAVPWHSAKKQLLDIKNLPTPNERTTSRKKTLSSGISASCH